MMGLTRRQDDILRYLDRYIAKTGTAPSYVEIGAEFGLASKSGVKRLLDCLEERGAIRRLYGRARAIEIVRPRSSTLMRASDAELLAEVDRRGLR